MRYVRNITDVGHLENEVDETGEDRISRRARQENLEPMEVVQKYMNSFHKAMERLNTLASLDRAACHRAISSSSSR